MSYFGSCDSHMLISYLFIQKRGHKRHHDDEICVALPAVSIFLYSLSHLMQQHSVKDHADATSLPQQKL